MQQIRLNTFKSHKISTWRQFKHLLIDSLLKAPKKNLAEFIPQLESCMQVAAIPDAQKHQYHLHLEEGALSYFDQLADATRDDYALAISAQRQRYSNDRRIQLQKLLIQK